MKIVVIEDEALVRSMVLRICRTHAVGESVHEAADGASGLRVCLDTKPDLVLLDIDLPDCDGLDLADQITAALPRVRIVVLSARTDDYHLHRVFTRHFQGFVDKNDQPIDAIEDVLAAAERGNSYFSPTVQRARVALRENPQTFSKLLSEREQELLRLFGQGQSNEEIASALGLAPMTVQNHRRNILGKLGLHSTPELIRYAAERGFARFRSASPKAE
ncbi:MAG: response regulator transcription factor [Candidatus Didemnitutus sp.]|nr:response regulator transcription factor [Candidatus Didemnitutus sp.]